jgi:hypothetical protein
VSDAIRIEQRLAGLFASRRDKARARQPNAESPGEIERRAMEQLYGERSRAVVRAEPRDPGKQP